MALISQTDFCKQCGKDAAYVTVNVKRGKLVRVKVGNEYHFDDTVDINKAFLEKWKGRNQITEETKKGVHQLTKPPILPPENLEIELDTKNIESYSFQELDKLNKSLDAKKKEKEIRKLEIQIEKAEGLVIPTEMVKGVFARHTKNMVTELDNFVERMITEFAAIKNLSSTEIATMREMKIQALNTAAEGASNTTKNDIENIIDEYSDKRAIGEKK